MLARLMLMGSSASGLDIEIDPERLAEWLARSSPDASSADMGAGAPQVIDVREQYEREAGHIADTRHIPMMELTSQAKSVERERPVVFYCRVGSRSDMAAQAFRAAGYEAYSMSGGLVRWAREGRPLEPADGHVANH
jgi:rhodanese-related sulfurtransferase